MKALAERPVSVERPAKTMSGLPILALNTATCAAIPFILADGFRMGEWPSVIGGFLVLTTMCIVWRGFFTLEPNEACVLVSWGEYRGTVREPGFHWTNPFARKKPVSLRAQSLCVDRLRVHDKQGSPVEMAATIVWRVVDTARASFDVQNFKDYVSNQCQDAIRHLGSEYSASIDSDPANVRHGVSQLQVRVHSELQDRVARAGIVIDEVRLTQRCEKWFVRPAEPVEA